MSFFWDTEQNNRLRAERGIGFEDAVFHIERGDLLDIVESERADADLMTRVFVVRQNDAVYLVPFAEDERAVSLKTIIPSRKATKQYLGKGVRR